MSVRARVVALFCGLVIWLAGAQEGHAGDQKKVVQRIGALNTTALAAHKAGKHDKAAAQLLEAVVLGKQNGLGLDAAMARTYLHLGVVQVAGLKDEEKGVRNFALALRVQPGIKLPPALASKPVRQAFERARTGGGPAVAEASEPAKAPAAREAPPAKQEAPAAPAAPSEGEKRARSESEKLQKELAQAEEREKKERAEKDRLQKEKQEAEKQLAEVRQAEKKEREARERLEKEKQEAEKQLAEVRQAEKKEREARQALETAKGDAERLLAEAREREKKEREAKQKLEADRQLAAAEEKERRGKEEKERLERETLAAGPDLPATIPQPLFCPAGDEGRPGKDVFVHCAPRDGDKVQAVALYYRSPGVSLYNALAMSRSRKGWFTAAIPAGSLTGKSLQYYAEALGPRGDVVAQNGKASLPNIMMLVAAPAPVASAAPRKPAVGLVKASAVGRKPQPARAPARRPPPAKTKAKAKPR